MRELVIVVGSSLLLPPNPTPSDHHPNKHKPSPLGPTKHSPPKLSCSSPDSAAATSLRPPLLMNVRQDLTSPQGNRLKYYADLASKLAEDGRLEDFLMIAESVLVSGSEPSQFVASLNVKLVSSGISALLSVGKIRAVVEVLSKMEKLGLCPSALFDGSGKELLARECRRLVNDGKLEEFVDLVEILAGFRFSIKEFVEPFEIIKMCIEKRNPHVVVRYANVLPHAHVLFSSIIHEFGKKRDLLSALIVYEAFKCKSNGHNMYVCRTIIDVCGLCGDSLKSRYIYEELLAQKVTPNIYVFNSLMNVNANDLSYTLHVYKQMQNLGVAADVASYNILLKACCLAGRVDLAQDVYKEIEHMASLGALKLDVITYSTIIKAFADAKMWQLALKVKQDMLLSGVTPNVITWSSLISACANAGVVEQAFQIFEEMLLAGCEPNSQCCNILLHACVEACQYDRAFRMFQSWKENGFQKTCETKKTNRSTNLVIGGAKHASGNSTILGCISDPHHLSISKMVPFTPTSATYNILMKACGTDYYRAKALMDEMKTTGLYPNHISWSILIGICGSSGNIGGVMQALKTMRDAGIKPDVVAYTTAIKELIEEWCEGVIQNNNKNQGQLAWGNSSTKTYVARPQSLLLEKVAAHLQKNIADNLVIDLRGLTKVEARIVVLAVLRMIKENCTLVAGHPVKDDMVIILGGREEDAGAANHQCEVQNAVTKLLRDELGLDVVLGGHKTPLTINDMESPLNLSLNNKNPGKNRLPMESESSARRPVVLQRLKVTRKSLFHWMQKSVTRR